MESNLPKDEAYDIRYSDIADGESIKKWLSDKETSPWYPPETESDIEVFIRNWIGFSKYKASLTATYKGEPAGVATIYLMPYIKVAHVCMVYFVVDPLLRRRGVGVSLLRNIKNLAKSRFKLESMHCEVFDGAPCMSVLEKCGFKAIIRQEEFVTFPTGPVARIIYESQL